MRKAFLILLTVVLMLALTVPALAGAHPMGQGKGCGCHKVPMGSIHTGVMKSDGANMGAAACLKCHPM